MRGLTLAFVLAAAAPAQEAVKPAELPAPVPLEVVLERARAYLEDYERRFGGVIVLERYEQTESLWGKVRRRRELVSDLLVARVPGMDWVTYRDVAEVDGKPVRDRQHRLERLLREAPKGGDAVARRYKQESARYNIGSIERNINVPTAALVLLSRANAEAVAVSERGAEAFEGRLASVLRVEEKQVGLLVRTRRGYPADSEASFWVDPATGAVLHTELTVNVALVRARVGVTYRPVPELGMLMPVEMREAYERPARLSGYALGGFASYEKFVRPEVTMLEWLKPGQ